VAGDEPPVVGGASLHYEESGGAREPTVPTGGRSAMALQLRASTGAPRVGARGLTCADGASVGSGCGEFVQRSGPHAQGRPWSSAGQCDWATVCASESESCDGPAAGCAWPVPASSWDPPCADVAGLHSAEDAAV